MSLEENKIFHAGKHMGKTPDGLAGSRKVSPWYQLLIVFPILLMGSLLESFVFQLTLIYTKCPYFTRNWNVST